MESFKATACHIRQVAGDPQAVQINLMRQQHTEISSGKHMKRQSFVKPKQTSHKNIVHDNLQASSYNKKSFDPKNKHKNKDRYSKCGDSTHVEGFQCPLNKFQYKACHKFAHFTVFVIKRSKHHSSLEDCGLINYKQEQCMHRREPYAATLKITVLVMTHFAFKSKYSAHKPI